ncbi:MAG: hypothetical protein Q4G10_03065 [Bacteroidia bacterium]|nr:hypothetical protein [Bacteroidia bacterium]
MKKIITGIFTAMLMCTMAVSCYTEHSTSLGGSEGPAVIYPDYKNVTIPTNIAPVNYRYAMEGASSATTTFSTGEKSVTLHGTAVKWNLKKWKRFIEGTEGKTIEVKAYVKAKGKNIEDSWSIYVSEDKVDSYLTYRLIEPAFQMWNEVSIEERCIENFDRNTICDYNVTDNSCMNCHIHGQQRGDLSMYYIRGAKGGAILNRDGQLRKLNLRAGDMISGTVYGEIHPSGRFGVFSTNVIIPGLHTMAQKRTEVYDTASDLTVADFDSNRMINLPHTARADKFETFPCFSADGESVFYCVADTLPVPQDVDKLRYHLVRVSFDSNTGEMGTQVDTVWNADIHNASACHPKASPDGKWVMFTVADYGTFPISHYESALQMVNLETGEICTLEGLNGNNSNTFHSWSSDSHWFVFASKRGDGQYSKPYFCHIDENGNPSKPFVLPQKSPHFYDTFLKSFNVPDLGRESTGLTTGDAKRMVNMESEAFSD